jgi:hypothetical protein
MIVAWPITARAAVAAYRREPALACGDREEEILRRLEADPDGKVSAALNKLKRHPSQVIFYVLQAADLSSSFHEIVRLSRERSNAYRADAEALRRLAVFYKGKVPLHMIPPILEFAEYLDEQAGLEGDTPRKLQIVRTSGTTSAPVILALRGLARKMRDELRIEHPPHDALRWLVEAALALDSDIGVQVVADALRQRMGVQSLSEHDELP